MCVLQKHVAVLFVPGALGVSGISVSAHSVQARPSRQCVALTASPTTTSANSACRPACIRRELTWRRPAAVMKVRNGVWDAVIFFLSSWPLKWCNYLHYLPADLQNSIQSFWGNFKWLHMLSAGGRQATATRKYELKVTLKATVGKMTWNKLWLIERKLLLRLPLAVKIIELC